MMAATISLARYIARGIKGYIDENFDNFVFSEKFDKLINCIWYTNDCM